MKIKRLCDIIYKGIIKKIGGGHLQVKEQSNSITGGFVWKLAERFLSQGITFLVSLVLARLLSPDDYGIISIILVFITFADVFVVNGFSSALIQKKDADELDFSTIFYCSLAVSIGIYIILFFTAPLIASFYENPILSPVLRVFALRLPISAFNSVQHAYVSRKMIFRKYFLATLGGSVFSAIVGISMAFYGFGVWAIVGQYLSKTLANAIVLLFAIKWKPHLMFSLNAAKPLMRFGWKVTASSFSGVFFNQLRSLIIGKFYTTADLAFYEQGRTISTMATDNIGEALMTVLFPTFANLSDDKEKLKQKLRTAIQIVSFTVFPVTIGLSIVAEPLVNVLLTEKWIESIPYIQLLCISSAISTISDVSLKSLNAIGRSDVVLKLEFAKKPMFLILLIIGIKINVLAVAVTMVIYTVYATTANILPLKKHIGYSSTELIRDLLPSILFCGAMVITSSIWLFIPTGMFLRLIAQIATGAATYISLAVITKNSSFMFIWNYIKNLSLGKRGK